MSVTLTQLRTQVYNILREDEDTSAYPYTLVDSLINSAQQRICSGLVVNTFTGVSISKGSLSFLEERKFYNNIASVSLSADTAIWASTITVTATTNYPTSGNLWINGNVIAYTGLTSTTFTGVSGILYPFTSGSSVYPAFTLPTDYMSTIDVAYNNSISIPYKPSKQIYRDMIPMSKWLYTDYYNDTASNSNNTFLNYQPPFYTIWDGQYFIPFWIDNSDNFFTLHYEKLPETLVNWTDEATIPNDVYAKNTIAYLATGEVLFNRGEEWRASQLLTFAYGMIQEMYRFYNNQASESLDGQQVLADKPYINI